MGARARLVGRVGALVALLTTGALLVTGASAQPVATFDMIVAGGPAVVSDEVLDELRRLTSGSVSREAGTDRFSTAAAVSAAAFPTGVPVAYVATGEQFPDGLAAGPQAARDGGPLLLVARDEVPDATRRELERLRPGRIVLVGGTGAVSVGIERQLGGLTPGSVTRVAGADRYATAAALSAVRERSTVDVVYIATGENYPDALTGGPAAAVAGGPLLLVRRDRIPVATSDELRRLGPVRIVVLGGPAAVSEVVRTELGRFSGGRVARLAGGDRFATAGAISAATYPNGSALVYVATGADFPDALAIGPVAGSTTADRVAAGTTTAHRAVAASRSPGPARGPVLLVARDGIPDATRAELLRLAHGTPPENGTPTATEQALTVVEDGSVELVLAGSDPDGDPLAFVVVEPPAHGTLTGTPPALRYTPDPGFIGSDGLRFTVSDGEATSAPAAVTFTVEPTHSFVITRAVVAGAAGSVGTACPPASNRAVASSQVTVIVCGYNRTPNALTPTAGGSSLGGTLVATPGTFGSGAVASGSVPVVLGSWTGTTVTASVGQDRTVVARIGAGGPPSPLKEMGGYTVTSQPPTAVLLSNAEVAENLAPGTPVGTLSATDPDAGDVHTFKLVAGVGAVDNASFSINGSTLATSTTFDFETDASYSVRVRATDASGASFERVFTVTVTDVNEAPTALALSSSTVAENAPSGTVVGTLSATDVDAGDSHTFALVAGVGDGDNASFAVDGSSLNTAASFDFETDASYSVRVRATDADGLTFERVFVVTVTDGNEAPTALALSNSTVAENAPSGTAVGTLSATDPDAGDVHTFSLVAGVGDGDNGAFAIVGSSLDTAASFDFETDASYSVRVGATDADGLTFEEVFTVTVTDVNEAPTALALSNSAVAENAPSGTVVGTLSATDPDAGDSHTFALVAGVGDGDNASFAVDGSSLNTAASFDFETDASYSVRVRATDADGLTFERAFAVTVTDVNEAPVVDAASFTVVEGSPDGTSVGTATFTDPDGAQTHAFSLQAGNTDGAFAIAATSGEITVANSAALDLGANPTFSLTVRVTDDGSPVRSGDETVTVDVVAANNAPVAASQGPLTTDEDASFAITLAASDGDGDALTFAVASGPSKGALGTIGTPDCATTPGTCTATVTYTPDADATGADSFTFTASDGHDTSTAATVTIDITAVNDAPDVTTSLGTTAYTEGVSPVAVDAAIAVTDIDSADLVGATVAVTGGFASGEDVLGFTDQLGITGSWNATTGTLTLTGSAPVADYQAALRSVTYANTSDAPSTASRIVTFTVNDGAASANTGSGAKGVAVTAVNDAPTLTGVESTDLAYTENDGPTPITSSLTVNDIDSADLVGATVAVTGGFASGEDVLGFTDQLGITGSWNATTGTLTLTGSAPVADYQAALRSVTYANTSEFPSTALRTATFTVTDGAASQAVSGAVTRDVAVTAVNDAPVAAAKSYAVHAHMRVSIPAGSGLLVDATDAEPGTTLVVGSVGVTTPAGGTVTGLDLATGAFSFDPPPGFTGGDVTFTYTVCDDGQPAPGVCSAPATVTVTVSGPVIWFVDATATGAETGRLSAPFNTLGEATAGIGSSTGHRIFLASGTYADGATMRSGGWIVGQPVTGADFDTVMNITPPSGTLARPSIGSGSVTVQGTVQLAANAKVHAVDVSSGVAGAMAGTAATGVDVAQTTLASTTGTTLSLNTVTGSVVIGSLTKNGAGTGVDLASSAAAVTIASGSISNTTASGITISGGTGSFSYAGTLTNSSGRSVLVQNRSTGSSTTLSGAITSTGGTGIALTNNTGATIAVTGGVQLATGTNPAFAATGGGTVTVTGASNTLTTGAATALRVENTTIGTGGLTFRSINANGPTNGIVLIDTGAVGGLTVTGTGAAGSGGTIQNTTGHGIRLDRTRNVSLSSMVVSGSDGTGIWAAQLHGTNTITGTQVTGSAFNNIHVHNTSGSATVTISGPGCTVSNIVESPDGNMGVFLQTELVATLTGTVQNCTLQGNRTIAIRGDAAGTSNLTTTITGNTIVAGTGANPRGNQGIEMSSSGSATVTTTIDNNKVGTDGVTPQPLLNTGINVFAGNDSTVTARVRNNLVRNDPALSGFGIRLFQDAMSVLRARVETNTVSGVGLDYAILVDGTTPSDGSLPTAGRAVTEVVVSGNDASTEPSALDAIRLQVRRSATLCARVSGNTTNAGGSTNGFFGLYARQANTAVFKLEGLASGTQSAPIAQAHLDAQNPAAATVGAAGTYTGVAAGSCTGIPAS